MNIAIKAARIGGETLIRGFSRLDQIQVFEKSHNDFVTEIDRLSEKRIIDTIQYSFPSHGIIGEETGEQLGSDYTWVIDPLDGTNNFIHNHPHFAVSIGILHEGLLKHGVIFDPIKNELFTATRGSGAQLNNRRIRVSKQTIIEKSLIGTGFPCLNNNYFENHLTHIQNLLKKTSGVRQLGSAALNLAYVAAGRFEGYWENNLNIWDIAAGAILIQEAGGLVIDTDGSENYLKSGNIIASNPKLLPILLALVTKK